MKSVTFHFRESRYVKIAKLPTTDENDFSNKEAKITGFGAIKNDNLGRSNLLRKSPILQEATVRVWEPKG